MRDLFHFCDTSELFIIVNCWVEFDKSRRFWGFLPLFVVRALTELSATRHGNTFSSFLFFYKCKMQSFLYSACSREPHDDALVKIAFAESEVIEVHVCAQCTS